MVTESSSLKGAIESPVQLLRRLEKHNWDHTRSGDNREWILGKIDWDEIKRGIESVPNGVAILEHYVAARSLAYYGHE